MKAATLKWFTRDSVHGRAIVCETVINGDIYRAARTPHCMEWTRGMILASVDHMTHEIKRAQEAQER